MRGYISVQAIRVRDLCEIFKESITERGTEGPSLVGRSAEDRTRAGAINIRRPQNLVIFGPMPLCPHFTQPII